MGFYDALRWVSRVTFGPDRAPPEKILAVNVLIGMVAAVLGGLELSRNGRYTAALLLLPAPILLAGALVVYRRPGLADRVVQLQGLAGLAVAGMAVYAGLGGALEAYAGRSHGYRYAPGLVLFAVVWPAVQLNVGKKAALVTGIVVELAILLILVASLGRP